jgi:hypothetical protein
MGARQQLLRIGTGHTTTNNGAFDDYNRHGAGNAILADALTDTDTT